MIQIGQYKFCQHSGNKTSKGGKKRWICSFVSCRGCRAFLVTLDEPVFTTSNFGNPLIQIVELLRSGRGGVILKFMGNTHILHATSGTSQERRRWRCSRKHHGCRVMVTTVFDEIISVRNQHNHLPPQGRHDVTTPVFTTSIYGNPIIQIGKYKFGLHNDKRRTDPLKKRWSCNLRCNGCKAYIVTHENEIITYRNEHNH
ncbi:FLYWCH zinc finger domain-containing protein [Phthorimaea operculella]|nr:FLYWCH zinc finger domain-containing protein [Phthorimaea operculella]